MGLKKLLWQFFPPVEVKATVAEVENFFKDYGYSIGKVIVEPQVKGGIRAHAEETVCAVRIEHKKPEYLA